MEGLVSTFRGINPEVIGNVKVEDALNRIINGASRELIESIRLNPDNKDELKKRLPGVTFGGTFNRRSKSEIIEHSGYAILDFDHVKNPKQIKSEIFNNNNFVRAAWISPSGDGVKVLCLIPKVSSDKEYKQYYEALLHEFKDQAGSDSANKDISRLTFESFDDDLLMRDVSNVYVFDKKIEFKQRSESTGLSIDNKRVSKAYATILTSLHTNGMQYINGNRDNFLFQLIALMNEYGIEKSEAENICTSNYIDYEDDEPGKIKSTIDRIYSEKISEHGSKSAKITHQENRTIEDIVQDDIDFPLEFYPLKEQAIMLKLVESKGLNIQHLGLSMLPAYGRIYSEYKAKAFNGSHAVLPIFWVAIVDNPGSTKSATMDAFFQPLSEMNVYSEEGNVLYTATNTTIEGLSYALSGKDTGIYLMYDELMTFIGSMGVYRQGGNKNYDKSSWLSLFNGKPAQIIRAGRGITNIDRQVISLGGTMQPKILADMFDQKDIENGFFDRFLWSVQSNGYPEIIENPDYSIDGAVKELIQEHTNSPRFNTDISFSKEAKEYLREWDRYWRGQIDDKKGTPEYNFYGKRVVYINRFALIAELIHSTGANITEISLESAQRAVLMDDFCDKMRMRAYKIAFETHKEEDQFKFDIRSVTKWLWRNYPGLNKKTFTEWIGVSRPTLDKWLKS